MKKRLAIVMMAVAFLVCLLNLASSVFAEAGDEDTNKRVRELIEKHRKEKKEKQHLKIDPNLTDVGDAYRKYGSDSAKELAEKKGLKLKDNKKIRAHIALQTGLSAENYDTTLLESYGVDIVERLGDILIADIPLDRLREIADKVEDIRYIEPPMKPTPFIESEAVSKNLTGSSSYISAGIGGAGVKVAVIDAGFKGVSLYVILTAIS
jgi:hypothetical protein